MAAGHGDGVGSRAWTSAVHVPDAVVDAPSRASRAPSAVPAVWRITGSGLVVAGVAAQTAWVVGRLTAPTVNLGAVVLAATDVVGIVVSLVLARAWWGGANGPVDDVEAHLDRVGPDRFAKVSLRHVGASMPALDRSSTLGALSEAGRGGRVAATVAAVLVEGPRRSVQVAVVAAGLLLGAAPITSWSPWGVAAWLGGAAGVSVGTWVSSGGAVRPGDRTAWSYTSMGPAWTTGARPEVVPARWVGVVAAVVATNVAIALRGVSDRWTHGLPTMTDEQRAVTLGAACVVVVCAAATFRRLPAPSLGAYGAARRTEERTARRLAVGATSVMAVIGLVAGLVGPPADASPTGDRRGRVDPGSVVDGPAPCVDAHLGPHADRYDPVPWPC